MEHVVELFLDEVAGAMEGADAPSADALADRAVERDRIEAMPPPRHLGPEEAEPPLDAFPARATRAILANLAADATPSPTASDADTVNEGGPFSHAAIVARESGCAAVTGAHDATTRIPHGADVEADPANCTVAVV